MMTRRTVLTTLGAAATARRAAAGPADVAALLGQAFIFGLPLLEMASTRQRALAAGARLNRWGHRSTLSDAKARSVTTPNSDTLYSSCWLDLAAPVSLSLPAATGRYQSIALMDAYTNVFHIAHAGDPPLTVLGPGATEPAAPYQVRAPTPMVWALARTYVADASDLPQARAAQQGLGVMGQDPDPARRAALLARPEPARTDVLAALARIEQLIAENPPPRRDEVFLKSLKSFGFGARQPLEAFDASGVPGLAERLHAILAVLRAGIDGAEAHGWVQPPAGLGRYGDDTQLRAVTALAGLGALPQSEARYWIGRRDSKGERLDGARAYRWTLAAGDWPPGAFWSLTVYEKTSEGQLYFHDNPLDRYALGPGKPGFQGQADQSVTLTLAHAAPASTTNWLPTPQGPFEVQLRLYRPARPWRAPAIIAVT